MDLKQFLQSKVATVLLCGMLGLVMFVTAKLLIQKHEVDSEISKLQNQAGKLDQSNKELSDLIQYLNTPEYTERQAREKLNLKKDGEHVVVLPKDGSAAGDEIEQPSAESNAKKWLDYFFGDRT
jgi:cell division protein FtsB